SLHSELETLIVYFDRDLLRQVLINLIKNAAEACTSPSQIKVSIFNESHQVRLTVEDNGPGIPDDMQKSVFEAYFTTKHSGQTAGMGLGLAVCQKIILDHHGMLSLSSKPGHTCFTITLPKTPKEQAT